MGQGLFKVFTASMASGGSTAYFDLGDRAPASAYLSKTTFSTAADIALFASLDNGTNYQRILVSPSNTSTVAPIALLVTSALTAGAAINIPVPGRYMAIAATAVVSGGATFKIACAYT